MSDRDNRDFDFDDDFFDDDRDNEIGFDDEEPTISGDFEEDMPEMDEAPERGTNRTFVVLAIFMILLFIVGIGVIIVIATRPTGPNDAELTATRIAELNSTVIVQMAATQTQDLFNLQLTQTALAASPTPTQTFTPTDTPTDTPVPPTNTPDLTLMAAGDIFATQTAAVLTQTADAAALGTSQALTQTALAQPTATNTPPIGVDLRALFATQAAYATLQGQFVQDVFATQQQFATQLAADAADQAVFEAIIAEQAETLIAVIEQEGAALQAALTIDEALATAGAAEAALAAQLAIVSQAAPGEQAVVLTPAAEATLLAGQIEGQLEGQPTENPEVAIATQNALITPPALATNEGFATQNALATRQALIELALLGPSPTIEPTSALVVVNQTATAIAGAFLTATALAAPPTSEGTVELISPITPFAPPPTAALLPDTGLFDDITGSGNVMWLALGVIGLIGVIVIARSMRKK